MSRIVIAVATVIALAVLNLAAYAAPLAVNPETALRKAFPQIRVDSIVDGPIGGVYEVASGANLFYFFPEKDILFVGDFYAKDGKNLTAEKRQELKAKMQAEALKKLKDLPLEKGVKVGKGAKTVIEFTDPDCPYCRRASEALKNRTDITRYVFLTPLAHPQAVTKVHYILSSADQEKAYHEMMEGKPVPDGSKEYSKEVKAQAEEYMSLARSLSIEGTPTFFINGQQVVGADIEKINSLLK